MVIFKAVSVHLGIVRSARLFKLFDYLIVVLVRRSLNSRSLARFGLEMACHRVFLNCGIVFLILFQIVLDFQNYFLGGFLDNIIFRNACERIGIQLGSSSSRAVLGFPAFIKNFSVPHFGLLLV